MKKLILAAFFCGSCSLFAQSFEAGASFGVSTVRNGDLGPIPNSFSTSQYRLNDGFRFGFRLGLNTYRFMGYEFGYAYSRSQLHFDGPPVSEQGMAIHQGFGGALLYATGEGKRIRPFLAGGMQFSNFVPPGASAASGGGQTKFGFNYGAGVKVKVADNWLLRVDFRQYESGKPSFNVLDPHGRFYQNEISAGFAFTL